MDDSKSTKKKHLEGCPVLRMQRGMKIWDKKNPEPDEMLDLDKWEAWFSVRKLMEQRGMKKICEEMGMSIPGYPYINEAEICICET